MEKSRIVGEFLADTIEKQSWYRAKANTINGVVASLAGVAIWIATYFGTTGAAPELSEALTLFVIPVLTALSLRLTKNGIGTQQANDLLTQISAQEMRDIAAASTEAERRAVVDGFSVYKEAPHA